ncbi:MAG: hypothetical protein JSS82_03855 [Bacteroidetes bacterium]|nr:hypothetical protein [Bacteroidota bacterium]
MSYDLMVFKAETTPKERGQFMNWYRLQTQWKETHGYNNPDVTTPELRSWMLEMLETFPAMNGPYAKETSDGTHMADYNIGTELIYVTFSWNDVEDAYETAKRLAIKHKVGFFNVSADNGEIVFPHLG